jgi:hypothetical protein
MFIRVSIVVARIATLPGMERSMLMKKLKQGNRIQLVIFHIKPYTFMGGNQMDVNSNIWITGLILAWSLRQTPEWQ